MADGPVKSSFTTSSSSSSNIQQPTGKKDNDPTSSYNGNIVLTNGINMMSGQLEEEHLSNPENQLVIRDALRLQRDLLQLNIAVPVKLKLVEKSIRDFRGFCAATQQLEREEAKEEAKNGESAQQSILSLLENVATSAAIYAKQLRDSTPKTRDSLSSADEGPTSNSNDKKQQERRAQKRQKKQQKIDQLLEKISQIPIELMFGVRIRRKYADEVAKRYGLEPQPYYADLTDSDSMSSFSSHASSSDESSLTDSKIGYNSTRINGVKKTVEQTKQQNNSVVPTISQNQPSSNTTKSKNEQKKRKKQLLVQEPVIQKPKNKKVVREPDSLDISWMDRLRIEMEEERFQKSNNGSKLKSVGPQDESLTIPPEAMEILKEALVAAAQDNGKFDDAMNEETARALATNFIRATAESAQASRHNQGGSSSGEIQPSSSSATGEIPGLSQDAAVEVWKEIQQYLRNLCSTNSAAQELAAKTAESFKIGGKSDESLIKTPPLPQMTPLPETTSSKKKRKTKGIQANSYPESVLERRRELLRLQAEKQQEHAMVVAQLREQEAKLRDAVAAATYAQRSSSSIINYKPPERPPFKIGSGPYGATYYHDDFTITAHNDWLDERMIARGLRVYIMIRAIERHRLFDYCQVRRHEAQFCLFLHCDKYRSGFLSYLCNGNESLASSNELSAQLAAEASELVAEFDAGDIAFYDTICSHTPKWKKIEWARMCNYHKRALAMDPKLPALSGDFSFLMNQLHSAYDSNENYNRSRIHLSNKRHPNQCECNCCEWEKINLKNPKTPPAFPFDPRKHNVELFLPTNYVLGRSVNEQRRLLRNQAQLSEKCIVVPRKPIADEEQAWSTRSPTDKPKQSNTQSTKSKKTSIEDINQPLPTPPTNVEPQPKQRTAQKKKKRK